ncbi:MAG TPA: FHA domain-containing protein, partial [Aggregicoccus sp.]|nr:FHA domain-containing protein [Aggregicoccus sp.]
MPTLVVLHPDGTETEHPFEGELSIGRQEGGDLVLPDGGVSRRHALLRTEEGAVVLEDAGSANGTYVEGVRLEAPCVLLPGVQVQLGDYLLRLAPPPRPARTRTAPLPPQQAPYADEPFAPLRRARGGAIPTRRGARRSRLPRLWDQLDARQRRLCVAAAAVLTLLLAAGLVSALSGPEPQPVTVSTLAAEAGYAEQVQALLSQCRSFASTEQGSVPDWERAEAACGQALDLDPLQSEGHALLQRIRVEREAEESFSRGEKALARLREEEALDFFQKIPRDSDYFRRARPQVREASARVVKRALDDCKRYLREAQWQAAVPRCERYLGVACQKMAREELEPPLGYRVVLASRRLRANEWRPRDPLFLRFLTARQRVDPQAAPWSCPPAEILAEEPEAEDPRAAVAAAFQQRYGDRLLQAAMLDYWFGRSTEAVSTLQKLRSDDARARFHAEADSLLRDLYSVDQLFKSGQSALQAQDPERAAA